MISCTFARTWRQRAPETTFAISQCSDLVGKKSLKGLIHENIFHSNKMQWYLMWFCADLSDYWEKISKFLWLPSVGNDQVSFFPPSCLYQCQWNENKALYSPKLERNQIWISKNQLNILQLVVPCFMCRVVTAVLKELNLVIIQNWTCQKVLFTKNKKTQNIFSKL